METINEGEALRNFLKGTGKSMGFYAEILQMTRQNLNHHLRKDVLDDDFKRLVIDKLKIDLQNLKQITFTKQDIPKSHPEPKGSILEYMLETGKDYAKKLIDIGKYPTAKDIADLEELAKKIEERKKSGE